MSSDHQPRTLLMAWKTSSGAWSTEKAAVKLALSAGVAVMLGLPSWACQHAPAPGTRRHRWRATAFVPSGYVLSRVLAPLVRSGFRRRAGLRRPRRTGPA